MVLIESGVLDHLEELFKVAPNSIAVHNSIPELKKIAKNVTTKESGEGVLEGLDMISSDL